MPPVLAHPTVAEAGAQESTPGDAELLRRYALGNDDAAFADLVRRHVDLVYSAALRQLRGDHPQAEDVTQLVFAELARKAARLDKHPALSGWLYTTTRFMARTAVRAENRRARREQLAQAMHDQEDQPNALETEVAWAGVSGVLDEAMHELGETDRIAVLLRHFEGRSFDEVGRRLQLSPNAARMRVDRALDKLRRRLARRGITSSAAVLAGALAGHAVQAAPAGLSAVVVGAAAAVAVAPVPGVGVSALYAMMSLKSKLILTGIAASLVIAPMALQHRTIRQLREGLAAAQAELGEVARAESDARRRADLVAAENGALKASQLELLRLRGEVGPLRDQVRALTRSATADSVGARAVAAPKQEPRNAGGGELADLGSSTAEHAATSLIWAVSKGRVDRLQELLELPPGVAEGDAPRHYAFLASQISNAFTGKDLNGWKVDVKGSTHEDRVRLDFGYHDLASGKDDAFGFQLRRHEDGWKVLVEGEVPEDF